MVTLLFALALCSFALMGVFVLGLVMYTRRVSRRKDAGDAAAIDVHHGEQR